MIDKDVAKNAIEALKELETYLIHAKEQKRVRKLLEHLNMELRRTIGFENHIKLTNDKIKSTKIDVQKGTTAEKLPDLPRVV